MSDVLGFRFSVFGLPRDAEAYRGRLKTENRKPKTGEAPLSSPPLRARPILFSAIDSNWAGAQAQMLELAVGLDRTKWTPLLLTSGDGGLVQRAKDAGIRTLVVPFGLVRRQFPFLDFYVIGPFVLRRVLRSACVELVHAHDPNSPNALAPVAAKLGIPFVLHVHDLDQRWITRRSLDAMRRARAIIVGISDAAVRWAVSRGATQPELRRVYNGVHLAPIAADARAQVRRNLSLGDDEIAVALVGRVVPRKGQADAIRAFADPSLRDSKARLFLIGGTPAADREYEQSLHVLVHELGLETRVTFLGEVDDVPAMLGAMDLSVVPARREAFGRVVIEGMHAGTPVVSYDDGALPELVRDNIDGLIVPTGDIAALASAVARLAGDDELRARMAASAQARAQEFSHDRFVAECSALYSELLAGR